METKQIQIEMRPTEGNHVFVECGNLTVNRVEYYMTAHYFLWQDGNFHLGKEEQKPYQQKGNLYMSRKGTMSYPSESAKKKTIAILDEAVNKWVKESKHLLIDAELKYILNAISLRKKAIEAKTIDIRMLKLEIEDLEGGEHLPTYSGYDT